MRMLMPRIFLLYVLFHQHLKCTVRYLIAPLVLFLPLSAHADLPLTVEDLLTAQNRWKVELGLNYVNSERTSAQSGQPIYIQTGPTSFLSIPTFAGAIRENTDTFVFTPGLRYGISGETELYTRSSWINSTARVTLGNDTQTQSTRQFADVWIGMNHRLIREDTSPALLGFAELALTENQNGNTHSAKSALLGFTTYRTSDPLVLALTTAYRLNRPYLANGVIYQNGNFLFINPSISFAVNPLATLSAGFNWRYQQPDRVNDASQGGLLTRTDFNLGLGYSYDARTILTTTLSGNLSGSGGAGISLIATFKLGELPKRERNRAAGTVNPN